MKKISSKLVLLTILALTTVCFTACGTTEVVVVHHHAVRKPQPKAHTPSASEFRVVNSYDQ